MADPDALDPRARFSATAALYERWRPSYPDPLFDWLIATAALAPGAPVVDLGCGTGIATRLLAARGLDVIGVDPNEDMLARARAAPGPARYRHGEATATGLPDRSSALTTAAQAFHWFELAPTLRELARIAAPGGWAAAFWNVRGDSPMMRDYEELLHACSRGYAAVPTARATRDALRAAIGPARELELEHEQLLDWEGLHGRAWSSSFVMHGVDRAAEYDRALAELFARHAVAGRCALRYRVIAIAWQP